MRTDSAEPSPERVIDAVYLGPAGTFTQMALADLVPAGSVTEAAPSVLHALDCVTEGVAVSAVVPFENSVEGSVSVTLDALIHGKPLVIAGEAHTPVSFVVAARPGASLRDIRRVATHPHAAAQTRRWLADHLPQAEVLPESSTARAAELVATGHYDAAIAAPGAAHQHGLSVLAENVADRPGAITRFVRLTRPGPPPPPTGADTTTLAAFLRSNHPGALLELLEQFAARGVDLTRLESRPTGQELGQYCFAIEADGHLAEPRMAEALTGLHRTCSSVRYLGSYPRADGVVHHVLDQAAKSAYERARIWVEALSGS